MHRRSCDRVSLGVEERFPREYDGIFRGLAALLSARGIKSPGASHPQQTPWCSSSERESLLLPAWRGSWAVAGHNTLCLPKAVSGRLVLARVKLLENQLLLRYCLWRAPRARDAPLARSLRLVFPPCHLPLPTWYFASLTFIPLFHFH